MPLTKYRFDSTEMPFTSSQQMSFDDVETKSQTEGGLTFVQTIRRGVFSMKVSTTCLSDMLKTYLTYRNKDSFVLTIYDPITETSMQKTVRMTNFSYQLLEKSYNLSVTNGIYKVSFNLEEF